MRTTVEGACPGDGDVSHRDAGMSLVEMLLALLVLGVLLSAFAGSLISFSKMTLVNERRVQATAFLTTLHEQLQTIPWQQAAIYENEIAELTTLGLDTTVTPASIDGDPLVLLGEPDHSGCPDDEPECGRQTFVPRAHDTVQIDGRVYELFQAVLWDSEAPTANTIKRFTTVARWTVGDQEFEQRFESTRAVTFAEAGGQLPPEIVSLKVSPDQILLDADGRTLDAIDVDVIFDRGITSASLEYELADAESGTAMDLDPLDHVDAKPISFVGTLPIGSGPFAPGPQQLRVVGELDGLPGIVGQRTVTFVGPDGDGLEEDEGNGEDGDDESEPIEAGPAPTITNVTVSRFTVLVGDKGKDDGKLCDPLTLTVTADNVTAGTEPGIVSAYYFDDRDNERLVDPQALITGTGDSFVLTFPAGSDSPWSPSRSPGASGKGQDVEDRLRVIARNPDGRASGIAKTELITFTTTNSGDCP